MQTAPGFTVREAAAQLRISPQRVLSLIKSGAIDATKVGRQYLVDPVSLHRRLGSDTARHRPLNSAHIWVLIALASHDETLPADKHRLNRWALSRVRGRLKRQGLLNLAPYLRGRAEAHNLQADPGDVASIGAEQPLVRTGISAAQEHGLDVVAPNVLEAYVPAFHASDLIKRYVLEPTSRPNVILRVIEGHWPFSADATVAPGLLAALDLYDSDDPRSKRAGRDYLQRLGSA
jgi:excisionase family DNA binding protein